MTSILRGIGALLLCAAVASQAMADDRASPASVANGFVDALQQQRFDEAAVMFSPERKRDGSAWADALRRLPARQREAFTLRVLEELDVATTAAIMRCSEGSVKTHLSRARHALQHSLKDWQ